MSKTITGMPITGLLIDESTDIRLSSQNREIPAEIFVFGSNLAGRHGKGAALTARQQYGAVYGIGEGRTGDAYAIPTKDAQLRTLPLYRIRSHIEDFIRYAQKRQDLTFLVTRIGCGLAGYQDGQIAPLFALAPSNCQFDEAWIPFLPHGARNAVFP